MTLLANTGVKSKSASRSAPARESFYVRVGKRWLDATVSLAGLILLSPVILVVGIAVKLTSSGPAFYRQFRVGQFGRSFRIVKFRSMVESADRARTFDYRLRRFQNYELWTLDAQNQD